MLAYDGVFGISRNMLANVGVFRRISVYVGFALTLWCAATLAVRLAFPGSPQARPPRSEPAILLSCEVRLLNSTARGRQRCFRVIAKLGEGSPWH